MKAEMGGRPAFRANPPYSAMVEKPVRYGFYLCGNVVVTCSVRRVAAMRDNVIWKGMA